MRIWIDLANSPHVVFFAPIVRAMRARGFDVVISARDFAQTVGLAHLHGLDVEVLGTHGGRSRLGKAEATLDRAAQLRAFAKRHRPTIAVSHNSYSHVLAARLCGIPCLTIMDYEHTPANHVGFRFANRILLPSAIQLADVRRYGATANKVVFYDGFKEQVYLEEFLPDRGLVEGALPRDDWDRCIVVVARPPADFAIYHRFKNPLFDRWLAHATQTPDVRIIVLPRTPGQRAHLAALANPRIVVPDRPLDGANLVYHADLVVSAGGTMNREAAVLGIPAFSMFLGEVAAVDRALASLGRMNIVRTDDDVLGIPLIRKPPPTRLRNPRLCAWIVDAILATG